MKLFKNVLKETTLKDLSDELTLSVNKNVWGSNRRFWPQQLLKNNQGTVSVKPLIGELKNKILNDIKLIIPKTKSTNINLYIWDVGSGISIHNDTGYVFASTIYLNTKWHGDDGGWFIWQDDDQSWKAILPEYNTLVLNESNQLHTVTPISHLASEVRVTLQIFGEN